jgi:peroxiredoxin
MFPHERSLVSKLKNRPFALLGVNTDNSAAEVKQKNVGKVTWRSWFDGKGGPICKQYSISAFPSLFVLDHKGIIRKKFVGGPDPKVLDALIEKLVKEAEKAGGSGGTASADDKKPGDDKPAASGGGSSAPVGFDIGNRAPEITGKDTNGKTFKLSEYKGKVVVLDFWGFW